MKRCVSGTLLVLLILLAAGPSCEGGAPTATPAPLGLPDPRTLPAGVLIDRIPPQADLVFLARRHVLGCPECQGERGAAHERFIVQPDCNTLVYSAQRQVYWMDADDPAHPVGQIT
ncbi:MAG: hypothetical protein KJ734_05725, partial [Chloroflexi bacterium]|nr:hypothetical protein [Chloroflexota bacterium]